MQPNLGMGEEGVRGDWQQFSFPQDTPRRGKGRPQSLKWDTCRRGGSLREELVLCSVPEVGSGGEGSSPPTPIPQ